MIRFGRDDKKNPEKMKMLSGRSGPAAGHRPRGPKCRRGIGIFLRTGREGLYYNAQHVGR